MSFLKKIFGNNQSFKECPRCLGKGQVDWADIERLNQELKWIPGTCAYCGGSGKVDNGIEDNVPVDASYLVINLQEDERKSIINGHPDALERGKQFDEEIDTLINQISYLHFEANLTSIQIAKFFFIGKEDSNSYESEKQDFINYVESVIQKKASKD
jgi:hypothetical protein